MARLLSRRWADSTLVVSFDLFRYGAVDFGIRQRSFPQLRTCLGSAHAVPCVNGKIYYGGT